jgi:hypothetical protein
MHISDRCTTISNFLTSSGGGCFESHKDGRDNEHEVGINGRQSVFS